MSQTPSPRPRTPTNAPFVVQRAGGSVLIELLEDSLVNRSDLERVCDGIERLIEQSPTPRFLLSFERVNYLSSVFLGKLIALNKKIRAKGGELTLTNINPRIREVFTLTKLDTQIPIRDAGRRGIPPSRRAWATLLAATAASGVVGLFFLGWRLLHGAPDRATPLADDAAALAMYYFIATILFAPLVYLFRRPLMQLGMTLQWALAGGFIAFSVAVFAVYLLVG